MVDTSRTGPVNAPNEPHGMLKRVGRWSMRPSARWPILALLAVGVVLGALATGGFAAAMHLTSTNQFCSSCHADNAALEWRQSRHYANRVGFVAGCSDCHEPAALPARVARKVAAFSETWHQMLGTIATPAKYEAHRAEMAEREWARQRASHSRECRTCHEPASFSYPDKAFLKDMHQTALAGGQACIDCHKGVAHKPPS